MELEYIYLEITEECNNACRYCHNFRRGTLSGRKNHDGESLSRGEITGLMKKIQADIPLRYVAISGGEPTLRTDFPLILSDLVSLGLSPVVMTNGVELTEQLLKKIPSGIVFEVTLLGRNSQMHNSLAGRDVFDQIIHNIAAIEDYGSQLVIAFVAMRANALEIYRVVELGLALGADSFVYYQSDPCSRSGRYTSELPLSTDILKESLKLLQKAVSDYCIEAVCPIPIPPCVVDVRYFPSIEFGWCPRGGREAHYTVDKTGLLRPCSHSSYVLGDLKREGFAEIISRDECISFWHAIPEECSDCAHLLEKSCRGGCTAAYHEFHGYQNRIDPFCIFAKGAS